MVIAKKYLEIMELSLSHKSNKLTHAGGENWNDELSYGLSLPGPKNHSDADQLCKYHGKLYSQIQSNVRFVLNVQKSIPKSICTHQ